MSVTITNEQAALIIELIKNDIAMSEFNIPEFESIDAMLFNLHRAELLERLQAALNNQK